VGPGGGLHPPPLCTISPTHVGPDGTVRFLETCSPPSKLCQYCNFPSHPMTASTEYCCLAPSPQSNLNAPCLTLFPLPGYTFFPLFPAPTKPPRHHEATKPISFPSTSSPPMTPVRALHFDRWNYRRLALQTSVLLVHPLA